MNVTVKSNHWFPKMLGVGGITLYPFILFSGDPSDSDLKHEMIHVGQVRKIGWIKFYVSYLWQYRGFRKQGYDQDQSYRRISFEVEAYRDQYMALTNDESKELNLV